MPGAVLVNLLVSVAAMRGLEPLRLEPADQEAHGPLDPGGDERAAAGWSLPDRLGCGPFRSY